ncbi:class I SAM-dependent methyltransferase [Streptomyces violaceusniger]|uniref:class I SAM-dependent methyltransferase n=1 Tax=Streptomyces violaceusniger TaxID=68280 RepID=UPI00343C2142
MQSRVPGAAGYEQKAEELARRYEGMTFEAVHKEFLPWLPPAPGRVLDIGAGSGRDAAALATRGHQVVAVEPTPELRRIGQRLHPDTAIRWIDDALPSLTGLQGPFDFTLLSAVWMHLDEQERVEAMQRLADLVAPGGCVALSLRHGPVPTGRRMFAVSAAETVALAERFGLSAVHRGQGSDRLSREDVSWSTLVFRAEQPTRAGVSR